MIQSNLYIPEWIDAKKQPPPPNTEVLHYYRKDDGSIVGPMASIADLFMHGQHYYKPTVCWMPIPALPDYLGETGLCKK
ncbi:hypothetical protein [Teredinibacter turnerae]|uniref:hypothetical protein n=1 Tax=Teredinibacter turnerae TaxID=2426 RepID=UPI0030CACE53